MKKCNKFKNKCLKMGGVFLLFLNALFIMNSCAISSPIVVKQKYNYSLENGGEHTGQMLVLFNQEYKQALDALNHNNFEMARTKTNALIVNLLNNHYAQCDFANPQPWFTMQDIFCRNNLYPLIPERNPNVVTGQGGVTTVTVKDTSKQNNQSISLLPQFNENNLNSFMVNTL